MHPWRICPAGQYYRRGGTVRPHTRNGLPVKGGARTATCAHNPTGKDQLYPEEMHEISEKYFGQFKATPLKTLSEYKRRGNRYDYLIQGWVQYWNEVLNPKKPIEPDLIKALVASESGFNPKAWNGLRGSARACGLLQVTDKSLRFLSDHFHELDDHFLNLTEDDMLDPNLAISAGVRWIFRKKQLAESKAKKAITWRDAVAAFKGVAPTDDLMKKFDRYYAELKGDAK